MAAPEMSQAEQAKLEYLQNLEIEMMSDLYNRMTSKRNRLKFKNFY